MSTLRHKGIYTLIGMMLALFAVAVPVHAQSQSPLSVDFVPDPLFEEANFLPGDDTSGEATVTNNSGTEQAVLAEAINVFDNDGFGSKLHIVITDESATTHYDDTLDEFFQSGEVSLGTLGNGASRTYTFTISFVNTNDNTYQGKNLGFDLCMGFEGGDTNCGGTEVSDENNTNSGSGSSGGGGGGNNPNTPPLQIFNERVTNVEVGEGIPGDGTAVIEWDTNLLATSRVVYGLASGGDNYPACLTSGPCYNLDLSDAPNFGYPFSTTEDPSKVVSHLISISGLSPGEVYSYRVISRASPDTASFEHQFTLTLAGDVIEGPPPTPSEETTAPGGGTSSGTIPAVETGEGTPTTDDDSFADSQVVEEGSSEIADENEGVNAQEENGLQAAAALFSIPDSLFSMAGFTCLLVALLILLALYLVWLIIERLLGHRHAHTSRERCRRALLFLLLSTALAALITWLLSYICLVVPLLIMFVVLALWFALGGFGVTRSQNEDTQT